MADAFTAPDAINDDLGIVSETETSGDIDGNVLTNDTNPDGVDFDIVEVGPVGSPGTPVAGQNGGFFTINTDGTVDFDAAGDFDDLTAGETRTTSVTYTIEFEGSANTLDILLLQDLSGSFSNDLPSVRAQFPSLAAGLTADFDAQFGVASYIDKPYSPFGAASDYAFQTGLAITSDLDAVQAELNSLSTGSGRDGPESQMEALLQVALLANDPSIGYRSGAQRFVVLTTDAQAHFAGDFASAPANNLDTVLEEEDYPTLEEVRDALDAANITPIFAVTSGVISYYEDIVDQFGFGSVVELSSDSSNLESAISDGIAAAPGQSTATVSVTVEGDGEPSASAGTPEADVITGTEEDDLLNGYGRNDTIYGLGGDDTILGGSNADDLYGGDGEDLLYGGSGRDELHGGADDDILLGNSGFDTLAGDAGLDILTGGSEADEFQFDAATVDAVDVITDYSAAEFDRIALTGFDAGTFAATQVGADVEMAAEIGGVATTFALAEGILVTDLDMSLISFV